MTELESVPRPPRIRQAPSPVPIQEEPTLPLIGMALVAAIAGLLLFMAIPDRPLDATGRTAQHAELELRLALAELRSAIAGYRLDHDSWPGLAPQAGERSQEAAASERWFVQLLESSHARRSRPHPARRATHPYAPYLTRGVPANPFNGSSRVRVLALDEPFPVQPSGSWGWIYSARTGELRANTHGLVSSTAERIFDL